MREHIAAMVGGPGTLRFFIQPAIAILLGIIHGVRDHRQGRGPYLIALVRASDGRWRHLGEGLRAIVVPLCLAVAGSYLFQYLIRRRIYFFHGLAYAVLFVAIPYFVTRALANRLASLGAPRNSATASS
jgi:hypothetical protein